MTLGPLFFLLASLAAPARHAQPAEPALPRLALDTYPPAARDAIAHDYRDASARPGDGQAAGALGRTLQAWEQWSAAREAYARAEALAPDVFEWHYLDAVVLQRLARHSEAAERLKQALAVRTDYAPARVKLADALFEAGDLQESRRLFEALAREPDSEPMGQFGLGRVAAAEGRHEAAVEHLRRAIALFPEFGAAHYRLALSYRALGKVDEAERALERHTQYGPRWPALDDPVLAGVTALRGDARADLQRGVRLSDAGDLPGAIAAHETALARDPALAQAHENLISLYGRLGNWEKAEEHFRAAAAAGFDLDEAHYEHGVLLGLQERWEAAADAYRRAIAINPLHARAHNNLGQVLERQPAIEAAAAEYRLALDAQPSFRLARMNFGRMLLALGRTDEALAQLAQLAQPRDAETPRYLFALAAAHVRAGHRDEGIRLATEARQLAIEYGQNDLAAAIARDLAALK